MAGDNRVRTTWYEVRFIMQPLDRAPDPQRVQDYLLNALGDAVLGAVLIDDFSIQALGKEDSPGPYVPVDRKFMVLEAGDEDRSEG